jgi:hypothetical protein
MDEDEIKPAQQVSVEKSKNTYENEKTWCFHNFMGTPTQKYENPAIKMLNAIILKTLRQVV